MGGEDRVPAQRASGLGGQIQEDPAFDLRRCPDSGGDRCISAPPKPALQWDISVESWVAEGSSCVLCKRRDGLSECGPWTSSVSTTWELVRKAHFWTSSQTDWIRDSGGAQPPRLDKLSG